MTSVLQNVRKMPFCRISRNVLVPVLVIVYTISQLILFKQVRLFASLFFFFFLLKLHLVVDWPVVLDVAPDAKSSTSFTMLTARNSTHEEK